MDADAERAGGGEGSMLADNGESKICKIFRTSFMDSPEVSRYCKINVKL